MAGPRGLEFSAWATLQLCGGAGLSVTVVEPPPAGVSSCAKAQPVSVVSPLQESVTGWLKPS